MANELSYEGLTEAETIHALYHGTRAYGMGFLHNNDGLTVDDVEKWLAEVGHRRIGNEAHIISLDYVAGRPVKVALDTKRKVIERVWLYDRDAGEGACAEVIARALAARKVVP